MNTLVDFQNMFCIIWCGGTPLAQAKVALTFRTSCALARTPGCDLLMVVTRSCETAPLFIFL